MKNGFLLLPESKTLPKKAERIISVVPSLTELLYYFGLDDEVMAITRFCIKPEHWHKTKTRIGGNKQLHLDKIKELQPDLIIANKEENLKDEIQELAKTTPIYVSEIYTLEDALDAIEDIGKLVGKEAEALDLNRQLKNRFDRLKAQNFEPIRAAYFIWKKPWMAVGRHTFIDEIMRLAGFENVFADRERYFEFELDELKALKPELLLLSSEPYPFAEKHKDELSAEFDCPIELVDGEIFCWFGSRLLHTVDYLLELRG